VLGTETELLREDRVQVATSSTQSLLKNGVIRIRGVLSRVRKDKGET
jgi:hypothetical protein